MSELVWNKPVICIFKERDVDPEVDPFVVVKARKMALNRMADASVTGKLEDFFTLMGDADYLSTAKGEADQYIMCWFDDTEPDMNKDLRRLRGVKLTGRVTFVSNEHGKRTYNATFKAAHAKLK